MKIDVSHIAKLANLSIKEKEAKKFEFQLSKVLDYVKKLEEVNTSGVEPTSQVTGLENITRQDHTTPSLSQEEVLKNGKSTHNRFFKVKAVLEE